jgi:hypothetical protein
MLRKIWFTTKKFPEIDIFHWKMILATLGVMLLAFVCGIIMNLLHLSIAGAISWIICISAAAFFLSGVLAVILEIAEINRGRE